MQSKHVTAILKVIGQIIKENGKEPIQVYGFTNHVDLRLAYTLKMLRDENKALTERQRKALVLTLYNFIHSLETDEKGNKTYLIPGSGTYVVSQPDTLDKVLNWLQTDCDTEEPSLVERVQGWFSRWL